MALVLNGSGSIAGLSAGGISDAGAIADAAMPSGSVLQVVGTNFSDTHGVAGSVITNTTAYNNTGLTPLISVSITPASSNSYFYISLTGGFGQSNTNRSQILLTRNYTAGTNVYAAGNYIWYDHYGIYNNTGGDLYTPGSFSYMDKARDQTVGVARTYYWFGGSIGGGTQIYRELNATVMEIAQ